jgi:hypothetical protein
LNEKDKATVEQMIRIYCHSKHGSGESLCVACLDLKKYVFSRLEKCRFGSKKTTCNKCKVHCYSSQMREEIKKVMRFSGPRMLLKHPVAAIVHWWKEL